MRTRLLALALVVTAASVTFSLIRGQAPAPATPSDPAPAAESAATPGRLAPARDLSRLTKLQQQVLFSAQSGADWLFRMHGVKGRFLPGYIPALKQPLEGDSYQRQAAAAAALARAAKLCGEERYAARATQAVLALLEDTAADAGDSLSRYTTLPPAVVNRLGAAGQLALAIYELPAPQKDLLDRAEELTRYLSRQANPDGTLRYGESKTPDDGVNHHPGVALAALARSHRVRPAPWKAEAVRKAAPAYRAWWKAHRSPEFVPMQTAAFAEAYLATRDKALADFVFEMNDWVCSLQYTRIDPRRMNWFGGFQAVADGGPVEAEPTAGCAGLAEGLCEASRVAREVGDVERHQRYAEAAERCLQFLSTLQYTEASTQHFASWYRERLVGGFHASHQDGNLRLDHTQQAVSAKLAYLEHVAR
ncbi:MAG: hypothetical protein U0797_10320 [Gemmataceae bacterium]